MPLSRRDLLAKLSAAGAGTILGGLFATKSQGQGQGYDDTPMLPGGHWRVHDSKRPQPKVVTPGAAYGQAPSDAKVLFSGGDMKEWKGGPWTVTQDYFEVKRGTGSVQTLGEFGDCQLHLEFCEPAEVKNSGQGRGNSGIFFMGQYEVQVLDAYNNLTYADGTTGCVYGQTAPLVNACRKPGEWQTYDIIFVAPRFKDGKLETPAYVTVFLNGILVQHSTPLIGETSHRQVGSYTPHGLKGPITLQDHGDPVRFRNIWIREVGPHSELRHRSTWEIG
jgi:hypothetical protein